MVKKIISPWTVTLVVALLYTGWILQLGGGDPLTFAEIGTRFSAGDPHGSEGYDGQFSYFIAVDPAAAPAKIDVPPYRFQRILYPMLTRLLAGGQIGLIPWVMVGINLAALVGAVVVAQNLLIARKVNRWYALPVGLYAGQLLSVRVDLPEPLALFLMLAALWAFERPRFGWLWSVVLLALAVFTKESMLITGAAVLIYLVGQKEFRKAAVVGAILVGPFAIYQVYLLNRFGRMGVGSGGAGATPFELIPFGGLIHVAQTSMSVFLLLALILGPTVLWPVVWALFSSVKNLLAGRWRLWTLALGLNALVILFLPTSTFREPLAIVRFTGPLVALTILHSAQIHSRRALNYSYLWLATLILLLKDPLLQ
jgi:hypothetical protein